MVQARTLSGLLELLCMSPSNRTTALIALFQLRAIEFQIHSPFLYLDFSDTFLNLLSLFIFGSLFWTVEIRRAGPGRATVGNKASVHICMARRRCELTFCSCPHHPLPSTSAFSGYLLALVGGTTERGTAANLHCHIIRGRTQIRTLPLYTIFDLTRPTIRNLSFAIFL